MEKLTKAMPNFQKTPKTGKEPLEKLTKAMPSGKNGETIMLGTCLEAELNYALAVQQKTLGGNDVDEAATRAGRMVGGATIVTMAGGGAAVVYFIFLQQFNTMFSTVSGNPIHLVVIALVSGLLIGVLYYCISSYTEGVAQADPDGCLANSCGQSRRGKKERQKGANIRKEGVIGSRAHV